MTAIAGNEAMVHRAEAGLRWLAVVLCLLAGATAAAACWSSAQSAREQQSLQRAAALAQSLAARISKALALGIPFDRLQGVEAAFAHALDGMDGMRRIALVDTNGALVRQAGAPANDARVPAMLAARTAIRHADAQGREWVSGFVEVHAVRAEGARFAWELCVLLLATASIGALTVSALWQWKLRRGPASRLEAIDRARQLAAAGDWTAVPDAGPSQRDRWIHAYGARVRALTERYRRVHRLTASLVSTEPEQAERRRLAGLHEHARGLDRFPTKDPDPVAVPSALHDLRLVCFLMLATGEAMRLGAGRVAPSWAAWLIVLYMVGALAGQAFAVALGRSATAGRIGSAPALIVQAAVLIASGWLVVASTDSAAAVWIGRGLSSVGVGIVIGVATAYRAAHAATMDTLEARRSGGIERSIGYAGEWVGPLLGFVLASAAGPAASWLLSALALASGWLIGMVATRQAGWRLRWPDRGNQRLRSSDDRWFAIAGLGCGALLAWLCVQTARSVSLGSPAPAMWWLAYGAGICLTAAFADALGQRFVAARRPRALAAIVALSGAVALCVVPIGVEGEVDWRGSVLSALSVLATAIGLGLAMRLSAGDRADIGHGMRWLPPAIGASIVALLMRAADAA